MDGMDIMDEVDIFWFLKNFVLKIIF